MALRRRTQFNVSHPASGLEFDLIVLKRRPFSRAGFDRRSRTDLPGGSQRQIEDVARLLHVNRGTLDVEWMERWVGELGLSDEGSRARALSDQL